MSFVIPSQGFVTDRTVALLVASNTEPGLVILRFLRKAGLEKLPRDTRREWKRRDFG